MPYINTDQNAEILRYNEFVLQSPFSEFSQDIRWSEVKQGWIPEYVYLEDPDTRAIIAGLSILVLKNAQSNKALMYANRGPVCDFYNVDQVCTLIEQAELLAKKYNAFALRLDPEVLRDDVLVEEYRKRGFTFRSKEAPIHSFIQPRFNAVLSLVGQTPETLLASFHKKTRYNIKVAQNKGVSVRWSRSQADLEVFYELTKVMAQRQGITYRPQAYFEHMLKAFPEIRIYIAEHEHEPLSAAIAFPYNKKLWYLYGASSNEKRNLMPNYAMQWEMILWALELGMDTYDFGGVFNFESSDGLYRFKKGFLGESDITEWIGELDVVYDQEAYEQFISRS